MTSFPASLIRRAAILMRQTPTFLRLLARYGRQWRLSVVLCLCIGLLGSLMLPHLAQGAMPGTNRDRLVGQVPATADLLQRGRQAYERGQLQEAISLLQTASEEFARRGDRLNQAAALRYLALVYGDLGDRSAADTAIATSLSLVAGNSSADGQLARGRSLEVQGRLALQRGQAESALTHWQQAEQHYQQGGDRAGVIRSQINQAQALQALGLYRRALISLTQTSQALQNQPDSLTKAVGLRSLGDTLRLTGNLEQSRQVLQTSLEIAQRLNRPDAIWDAQFSLGNTARAQGQREAAQAYYQQVAAAATPLQRVQAQVNQVALWADQNQWGEIAALLPQLQSQLNQLPPSHAALYARVNLAASLIQKVGQQTPVAPSTEAARLLATAVQQAREMGDRRVESHSLGLLGALYEQNRQPDAALRLTHQALTLAQAIAAPDISYRHQWQLGRLLKASGDRSAAISAYSEAITTLKSLRNDLVAINPEVQFSFREGVEPVYRQFVSLLLQPTQGTEPGLESLEQARQVIESLQLAELDNFFREACLNSHPVNIDQVDQQAAVFYPIILPDRLEVIVRLPNQALRHHAIPLPQTEVEATLANLRENLEIRTSRRFLPLSKQVYDWLIRPVAPGLEQGQVKTLVFVLDGALRNISIAALHDGEQFVVEKYAVALTPGLQLLAPRPLVRGQLTALTIGLSEARQGFPPLDNVTSELDTIKTKVPSQVLLNQQFTKASFERALSGNPFPVVHLATHGQFSSTADDTFILTWDSRINASELGGLLQTGELNQQRAIELLVFSACQTAAGDNRAALGLAGVAVRSGARSTLASLWYVSDMAASQLMGQFYQALDNPTLTKAEALRRAQVALLQDERLNHPIYWAPFVLVGNWL